MDPIEFGYSMKNIPTATKGKYKYKLIEKVESVLKRMRWKAFFYDRDNKGDGLNDSDKSDNPNKNEDDDTKFHFKSRK